MNTSDYEGVLDDINYLFTAMSENALILMNNLSDWHKWITPVILKAFGMKSPSFRGLHYLARTPSNPLSPTAALSSSYKEKKCIFAKEVHLASHMTAIAILEEKSVESTRKTVFELVCYLDKNNEISKGDIARVFLFSCIKKLQSTCTSKISKCESVFFPNFVQFAYALIDFIFFSSNPEGNLSLHMHELNSGTEIPDILLTYEMSTLLSLILKSPRFLELAPAKTPIKSKGFKLSMKIREGLQFLKKLFEEAHEYLEIASIVGEYDSDASKIQSLCMKLAECLYEAKKKSHARNQHEKEELCQGLVSNMLTVYYKSSKSNEASASEEFSPREIFSPKNFKTRQTNAVLAHHFLKEKTQKLKALSPFRKKE
jgi:hypothetical protein